MSMIEAIREQMTETYFAGYRDATAICLHLLLGETPPMLEGKIENLHGCPQPLPPEVEAWARDALARVQEQTA